MNLEQATREYYHGGIESFEYTSPVSGIVVVNKANGRFSQIVYIEDGKLKFGSIQQLNPVGRPKKTARESVQELKNKGLTQEQAARELNVSLSTIRRNWK